MTAAHHSKGMPARAFFAASRAVTIGLSALILSSPFAGVAVAQQQSPATCASIDDDAERLGCYDAIFRVPGGALTDAVVLESEQLIPAAPTGRAPVTMTVACDAGELRVFLRFAGQLVSQSGDIAPVTFQVDSGATSVRTLAAREENTVTSFAAGADSVAFLDTLVGGTNLRVRMTPVRQRAVNVIFRLRDHVDEIATLRQTCG